LATPRPWAWAISCSRGLPENCSTRLPSSLSTSVVLSASGLGPRVRIAVTTMTMSSSTKRFISARRVPSSSHQALENSQPSFENKDFIDSTLRVDARRL
jgi:hypothetical protein